VKLLVAVVGATAVGKSDLAVDLAISLGGEVVNADSMQLYRGMDIGTAKLTMADRRGVTHHLLDVWDITRTASVAEYQRLASYAIDDILARGNVPVLTGGSGLYVRAALGDLSFPGTDPEVRQRLESELADVGTAPLHERLAANDPEAAAAILPSNGRRIVRALEVIEFSGRPFSATMPGYDAGRPATQIGIRTPRQELDRRIEARVDRMWRSGFDAEVRRLAQADLREGKTASRALGYRQMLRYLDGEWTLERAREETVRATRRFARRQESWFARDPRITWLDAAAPDLRDRAMALLRLARMAGPYPHSRSGGYPVRAADVFVADQPGDPLRVVVADVAGVQPGPQEL
jgi:tRNA dimethylallyltransferase